MSLQEAVPVVFIGKLNDVQMLAGIGLGNMVVNLLPFALMIGVNTALETLVSQAFGRKNLRDCGLYLHRASFVITVLFLVLIPILFNTENALVAMGMDPMASKHTQIFIKYAAPGLYLNSISDSLDLFLSGMNKIGVGAKIQGLMLLLQVFACWLFIEKLDLGIMGAGLAKTTTSTIDIILVMVYISRQKEIAESWYFPTKQTFSNLG